MKTAFFLRSLACAAILAVPAHAQLYSLHGDGVKKADRVVEKADYSGYELVWNDEFDKDAAPIPPNGTMKRDSSATRKPSGTSRKTPIARTAC